MQLIDITLNRLHEAPWNPNQMDEEMLSRLKESIRHYRLVQNLVARPIDGTEAFEVLSGNHRLQALTALGYTHVPCVVVDVDDAHARLLAQALNRTHGEDDLGLRAEAVKEILKGIPEDRVLSILPETSYGLNALATLGQQDMAEHLRAWQESQEARLKHLQFQLTRTQLEVVQRALSRVLREAKSTYSDSPNVRGTALYLLCHKFLEKGVASDDDQ